MNTFESILESTAERRAGIPLALLACMRRITREARCHLSGNPVNVDLLYKSLGRISYMVEVARRDALGMEDAQYVIAHKHLACALIAVAEHYGDDVETLYLSYAATSLEQSVAQ